MTITKETAIKLYNERQIRTQWDDDQEKWCFSIVDVAGILTDSAKPNNYWKCYHTDYTKKEVSRLQMVTK